VRRKCDSFDNCTTDTCTIERRWMDYVHFICSEILLDATVCCCMLACDSPNIVPLQPAST
jgi:hypothetical protein